MDMEAQKEAKLFLELHEQEWCIYKGHAHSTMKGKHWKTPELLPLKSDLECLKKYLVASIESLIAETERTITYSQWVYLMKLLVCRIITFNARRGGKHILNIFYYTFMSVSVYILVLFIVNILVQVVYFVS